MPDTADLPLVLVVDDFLDAREMYAEYFAFSGFRVVEATNGEEAVRKAVELSPHVILMDLSMPGMDGWEATRQLKAASVSRHIPIIVLSAHAMTNDRDLALAAGANDFDTKPVRFDQLLGKIDTLLKAAAVR